MNNPIENTPEPNPDSVAPRGSRTVFGMGTGNGVGMSLGAALEEGEKRRNKPTD